MLNCFIIAGAIDNQVPTFTITDKKLHDPVITLSNDNVRLLQKLKTGFKRTTNSNKHQAKTSELGTKPMFRLLDWSKFSKDK